MATMMVMLETKSIRAGAAAEGLVQLVPRPWERCFTEPKELSSFPVPVTTSGLWQMLEKQ